MRSSTVIEAILCENCHEFFHTYLVVDQVICAESSNGLDESIKTGKINRVVCHNCKEEFTFECPLLIVYPKCSVAAICGFNENDLPNSDKLKAALKIIKCDNMTLRITNYANEAAEKIRIAYYNLDDLKIEMFKLINFKNYKNMDLTDEYITFSEISDNNLIFNKCDFKDNILKTYKIPKFNYDNFNPSYIPTVGGKWVKIDRDNAIKILEEK